MANPTPTALSKAASISVPYASQIIAGLRTPSLQMAIQIFDATGHKFGPLVGLGKSEIETARKMAKAA